MMDAEDVAHFSGLKEDGWINQWAFKTCSPAANNKQGIKIVIFKDIGKPNMLFIYCR